MRMVCEVTNTKYHAENLDILLRVCLRIKRFSFIRQLLTRVNARLCNCNRVFNHHAMGDCPYFLLLEAIVPCIVKRNSEIPNERSLFKFDSCQFPREAVSFLTLPYSDHRRDDDRLSHRCHIFLSSPSHTQPPSLHDFILLRQQARIGYQSKSVVLVILIGRDVRISYTNYWHTSLRRRLP